MRRLVINRAYYSAFHVTRGHLLATGAPSDDTRFHQRLWRYCDHLGEDPGPHSRAWQQIGEIGQALHQQRLLADYDDRAAWTSARCRAVVADARDLVNRVGALTSR